MIFRIGLTIFILTVAFNLGNCSDDFDENFLKIGSYESKMKLKLNGKITNGFIN